MGSFRRTCLMLVPRCLQLKAVAVTASQLLTAIQTRRFRQTGKIEAFFCGAPTYGRTRFPQRQSAIEREPRPGRICGPARKSQCPQAMGTSGTLPPIRGSGVDRPEFR
jgi:hypothetical protein